MTPCRVLSLAQVESEMRAYEKSRELAWACGLRASAVVGSKLVEVSKVDEDSILCIENLHRAPSHFELFNLKLIS